MPFFHVHSLTAHKIYGEKASRYILGCILQRKIRHITVVPQKVWYGEEPGNHGVRLDVYLDEEDEELFDMEPDSNNGSEDDIPVYERDGRQTAGGTGAAGALYGGFHSRECEVRRSGKAA